MEMGILLFRGFQCSSESENSSVLMTCRLPALPITIEGNGFRKKAEHYCFNLLILIVMLPVFFAPPALLTLPPLVLSSLNKKDLGQNAGDCII